MAARDDLFQILPVLVLVLKRPAAAPRDPDPGEIRLLEQPEHLLEIAVIDVGQYVLLFSAELATPPGPLGLPVLDLSAIQADETKIPLLRPQRHVFRLGAKEFRCRLKMGSAEQQGRGDQTNYCNAFPYSDTLHGPLPMKKSRSHYERGASSRISQSRGTRVRT